MPSLPSNPLRSPSAPPKPASEPPVPTMTSASLESPEDPRDLYEGRGGYAPAPELAENITARPMSAPSFTNITPSIMGRGLSFRWMFTDIRRQSQVRAQGWRNATSKDIEGGGTNPYSIEGGSKFVDGDLILMCIAKERYLGALRYKHDVAARLADAAVQKTVSAQRAAHDMGEQVAGANRRAMAKGGAPVMQVFTPGAADLSHMPPASELSRLGNHVGGPDMATGQDVQQQHNKGE